jgi:protein-S-isoprenylcysteine O-methyltransferase Ste14
VKTLKTLLGSGDRIMLFTAPFIVVGVVVVLADRSMLRVVDPPTWLQVLAIAALVLGLVIWAWSVILIITNVPKGRLITSGPYAWMKRPLYTAVALLVLPAAGVLLGTWLGVVIGAALYVGSRLFAPAEEAALADRFGASWRDYSSHVKLGWL